MLCAKKIEGPSKSRQTFVLRSIGGLSIQPKIQEISVGTSNGTDHFGLVRPEYSGPALKMVHFDRTGHFGRSVGPKCPFPLTKSWSPVPLLCIMTRTMAKCAVAWVGSVQRICTVPLAREISEISNRNFVEWKAP